MSDCRIQIELTHVSNTSVENEKEETQPLMMKKTRSIIYKRKVYLTVFLGVCSIMNLLVLLFEILEISYVSQEWTPFSKLTVVASSVALLLDIISFVYLLFYENIAECCFYLFLQLLQSCIFDMFRVSFYNDLKEESYRHAVLTKIDLCFYFVTCVLWLLDGCRCKERRIY